jgi:hypothetical protein
VAALLLASCFGDSTGPRALRRAQFAIAPLFDARALDAAGAAAQSPAPVRHAQAVRAPSAWSA